MGKMGTSEPQAPAGHVFSVQVSNGDPTDARISIDGERVQDAVRLYMEMLPGELAVLQIERLMHPCIRTDVPTATVDWFASKVETLDVEAEIMAFQEALRAACVERWGADPNMAGALAGEALYFFARSPLCPQNLSRAYQRISGNFWQDGER